MTKRELVIALEEYDDDAEVLIAFQPEYPLQVNIANVIGSYDIGDGGDDGETNVVWIASGSHEDYAPAGVYE